MIVGSLLGEATMFQITLGTFIFGIILIILLVMLILSLLAARIMETR